MLNIDTTYPGQTDGVNANYPNGQAKNVTASGDGTGTPWEQQLLNDILGFMNAIVFEAGITVSGSPDTALVSDVLDGLKELLASPSSVIDGMSITRDSTVLMTTAAGSRRNFADTVKMILPTAMQKDISGTWVVGDGNGGLPDPLTIAADTWYRRFLVAKPDGTTDLCWDTSATAANFFVDANAITAGYSDATLYRRYGWTLTNGSSQMDEHFNNVDDPSRYVWGTMEKDIDVASVTNVSRQTLGIDHAPPNSLALLNIAYQSTGILPRLLITTEDQADVAASTDALTIFINATGGYDSIRGEWELNASSELFARVTASGTETLEIWTEGWIDNGVIA